MYQVLALRCENLGLWDLAVDILRMTRRPVQELSGLCTRAQASDKVDLPALYQKAELRPRDVYLGIFTSILINHVYFGGG